jgi:basic membrane lipoprotein Med (substrate-binding protein (PBP1-ABC) superfamily)
VIRGQRHGQADAQGILDQGVDVILPVGGPIYQSASAAIKDSGKNTVMLGVDADLAVADPRSPTRSSSPS